MIGIIDYGMGNLASVVNALNYIGYKSLIIREPNDIFQFDKLILPGVGAFGEAMQGLKRFGMLDALHHYHTDKNKAILGICLGMQLLLSCSNEKGIYAGLNFLEGKVESLKGKVNNLSVPNIGWSTIKSGRNSKLLAGIDKGEMCFYFIHSYYCNIANKTNVTGQLIYDNLECDVIFETENLFGCQFHPEKSQKPGLSLLRNFAEL